MMKKLICLLLTASLLLSFSSAAFALEFDDVADSPYVEAIYTLADFGIVAGDGDGGFRPDANITRAEFSAIMTRILGVSEIRVDPSESPFDDVTPETCDDWAIQAVVMAYKLGIIHGYNETTFGPKDNVTYEQAVKMIVCALGYEPVADEYGGYPNGYLQIAREKNITKNANMTQSEPAPRGLICQLVYNSLEIDFLTQQGNTEEGPSYAVSPGQNILTSKLKYTHGTGVVTGIQNSSLGGSGDNIGADEIIIDYNLRFKAGSTDAASHLGKRISYYYKEGDTDPELIYARATNANTETVVKAENIKSLTATELEYYLDINDQSETETVEFSRQDVRCLYNGKPIALQDLTTPDTGTITLIDNNNDNYADVLLITASQVIVVSAIDKPNFIVYNKYDQANSLTLNTDSRDKITIRKNNAAASFSSIAVGDVLLVSESLNNSGARVVNVTIITKKASGKVEEFDGEKEYTVNGHVYKASNVYLKYLAENPSEQPNLDDSITFYLDEEDHILYSTISAAASTKYGYLIAAGVEKNQEYPRFKIYTQNNKMQIFDGVEKVKINGNVTNYDLVEDELMTTNDLTNQDKDCTNTGVAQLIKYTTNSAGKIDTITTMVAAASNTDTKKYLVLSTPYTTKEQKYVGSSKTLGTVTLDSSTKIFFIPTDRFDNDNYSVKTYSSLVNNRSYQFEAYDTTETMLSKVILIYGTSGTLSVDDINAPVAIVDTIRTTKDTDTGETIDKLSCYINNTLVTYNAANTSVLKNYQKGDVLKLAINAQNKISEVKLLFSAAAPPETDRYYTAGSHRDTANAEFLTVYGTVYSKDDSRMIVSTDDIDDEGILSNENLFPVAFGNATKYYIYDSTGSRPTLVNTGTANDIAGYLSSRTGASKVFVHARSANTRFIIILKDQ